MMNGKCIGKCLSADPPPDYILSMPPPPLPSFLLPKLTLTTAALPPNDSQPCIVSFMCDQNPHQHEGEDQIVELFENNKLGGSDNTWLFLLVSSCAAVLILGIILALILLKCKETFFSSCHVSFPNSNIKQGAMMTLGEPTKSNPFAGGGILYPCATSNNCEILQNQLVNDSRMLWATLTPHGTRHFISDLNSGQDGHYEVVENKTHNQVFRGYTKRLDTEEKSFDNNGFVDFDYEDPTPLMDSYHDDIDSGYQEPQEVIGPLQRSSLRQLLSSPTRVDNSNNLQLNYATNQSVNNSSNQSCYSTSTTSTRRPTLNRRISDASSYNGVNM